MRLSWIGIALSMTSCCYGDPRGEVDTMVMTQYGPVQGQAFPVYNGRFAETVLAFHAIPYAQPPTGPLRFEPPVEVEPWQEVFEAVELGALCPQDLLTGTIWYTHPGWTKESEDCLTVDVYTPYDSAGGPYPVMVWFHGGSFQSGGAIQYPGQFIASHHVVVVVVQYRLGNFGFLNTGDDVITANAGLLDQRMSLQWVQNTIADFGGDPTRVTIAGESAGAASVGLHMISPSSQGLFHGAIMESGGDMTEWAVLHPNSNPENYSRQLAEEVNCPSNETTQAMVACLRTKTMIQIQRVHIDCAEHYFCLGMSPVIDGPGGFVPDWPRVLREADQFSAVPILSGINRDDASFANLPFVITEPLDPEGMDRANFTRDMRLVLQTLRGALTDAEFEVMYREFDFVYTPWPDLEDKGKNLEALNEFSTDLRFGYAWDYQSKMQQKLSPVFNYVFDYRADDAVFPEWTGATHTMELAFVWGSPLLQINPNVKNDSQMGTVGVEHTVEDIQQSAYMEELFTNFVKFGNPSPEPVLDPNGVGSTEWLPYTWEAMNYLYLQRLPYVGTEWRQKQYALTQYLLPVTVGVYFDKSSTSDGSSPPPHQIDDSVRPGAWVDRQRALYAEAHPELFEAAKRVLEDV